MKDYNTIRLELAKAILSRDMYIDVDVVNDKLDALMDKFKLDEEEPAPCMADDALENNVTTDNPYEYLQKIVVYPPAHAELWSLKWNHGSNKGRFSVTEMNSTICHIVERFGLYKDNKPVTMFDIFSIDREDIKKVPGLGAKRLYYLDDWFEDKGYNYDYKNLDSKFWK